MNEIPDSHVSLYKPSIIGEFITKSELKDAKHNTTIPASDTGYGNNREMA
jgi:hypothetical protein